ncbi:hydrogenase maturation protease [Nonomuraea fuscirosea]|uniref:hydrogenase maturation protease n=1 Tax=Nonomuraea fuscirosea TaxID=1291556 RepID=UPI00343647F2
MGDFWTRMEGRGPAEVVVDGVEVRAGSRVRLRPRGTADVLDLVLAGREGVVEAVEQDEEGAFHFAVTVDDDPGRDLGEARLPGHRFFYAADEIEPLGERAFRVLVAGIGNVFLGDDGFGVEVARHLSAAPRTPGVDVVDFGIRGMDLVYALQRDYDAVILVDASPRGEPPGTLTVLDPAEPAEPAEPADLAEPAEHAGPGQREASGAPGSRRGGGQPLETHGMDPVKVLRLAAELGPVPRLIRIVCCEPESAAEALYELSAPVLAAVPEAASLVNALVMEMIAESAGQGCRDRAHG